PHTKLKKGLIAPHTPPVSDQQFPTRRVRVPGASLRLRERISTQHPSPPVELGAVEQETNVLSEFSNALKHAPRLPSRSPYDRVKRHGYRHRITFVADHADPASALLPRVHLVVSLLKRWLLGTHQGAVSHAHLDYYLDEFTFRFNRRRSRHRGKLFYRLVQQ